MIDVVHWFMIVLFVGWTAFFLLCLFKLLHVFTLTMSLIIISVMVFYGYEYWHYALERNWKSDTIWGVRLWIPYLALPVGFVLLALQLVADLVAIATKVDNPFWLDGDS